MTHTDDARWNRSLRALFGEEMFAAVGARLRGDWRLDALDVMRQATGGPFGAVTPDDFTGMFPVSGSGAEQIVTTLQSEWFTTDGTRTPTCSAGTVRTKISPVT
ncbi:hypothetical protein ACFWEB_06290 [Streptomyces parvus]|uniref:hypothetical protein n=1 Tax=Streptomyces parvus TaxID=66428 RepID=UPI0036462F5D